MQRSQRRSTKVCTRCRQRKTKCDFKFPTCTSCKSADAPCLGFDPATRAPVPRSLVRSLEARVAELETKLAPLQAGSQSIPYTMASKIAQATISFGLPSSGSSYLHSKISSALFFRPSCPPLAVVRAREADCAESAVRDSSTTPEKQPTSNLINLSSIPSTAITRMIRNYADIHLPQYPCIPESMLDNVLRHIQDEGLADTSSILLHGVPADSAIGHFDYFILFIVLAISAMTLTWKAEDQALAASESFYNSALKHLQALREHSGIRSLQISLLLAHYAHMCPQRVDNWTCISDAVRTVLSLGLHKESPSSLDPQQRRIRCDLFWVAYGMERSLCTNLRLPLSFPEDVITTKLDFPINECPDSLFSGEDLRKQSSAKCICMYRALETEVHRVLHLKDNVFDNRNTSIESWIHDITRRLEAWYETAKSYSQHNMLEFKHVQFHHLRARIHRPTPRLAMRTNADRQIVLECCLALIDDYVEQEDRRRLFYPWHGVHILFETAVIALDACWMSRGYAPQGQRSQDMLEYHLPRCLQLLSKIGMRWGEATACAESLRPLLRNVTLVLQAGAENWTSHEAAITQEIHGLLFSDGSLTWDSDPLWGGPLLLDEIQFLDDPMFNNLEFLDWEPDWGIMPMGQD